MRKHPLHGPTDDLLRAGLEEVAEGLLLVALGMAAVAAVDLRVELVPGHRDLRGVQHDHVVARVDVRGVGGLVLALEDTGDPRRQAAERLVRRVNDVPASLDLAFTRRVGLGGHGSPCSPSSLGGRPRTTRRRLSPCGGALPPSRAGRPAASAAATPASSILPCPTSRRTATIRRTIPRRKASALTSIVTTLPLRLTRTASTVRIGDRFVAPNGLKSCRPTRTDPARAIATTSSGARTPSA